MVGSPSSDADKAMSRNKLPHPDKCGVPVLNGYCKVNEAPPSGTFVAVRFDGTALQSSSSQSYARF